MKNQAQFISPIKLPCVLPFTLHFTAQCFDIERLRVRPAAKNDDFLKVLKRVNIMTDIAYMKKVLIKRKETLASIKQKIEEDRAEGLRYRQLAEADRAEGLRYREKADADRAKGLEYRQKFLRATKRFLDSCEIFMTIEEIVAFGEKHKLIERMDIDLAESILRFKICVACSIELEDYTFNIKYPKCWGRKIFMTFDEVALEERKAGRDR